LATSPGFDSQKTQTDQL